jgi:hypothetical protein
MPSKQSALAVATLVVLAGCSAVPFVGGDDGSAQPSVGEPPEHHEVALASHTNGYDFDATVTISKDGEQRYRTTIESDGNGTYRNLTTLSEPGPYTVTVNTTIPEGDGYRNATYQVDGSLGNATVLSVTFGGIYQHSLELPRHYLTHDGALGAYSGYVDDEGPNYMDLDVKVWYRGSMVADTTQTVEHDALTRLVDIDRTGAYRIAVRTEGGEWTTKTVVVSSPEQVVEVNVAIDGRIREITVKPPWSYDD